MFLVVWFNHFFSLSETSLKTLLSIVRTWAISSTKKTKSWIYHCLFRALWKDAGIQKAFENRAKFQLTDSAQYFFEKLDQVAAEGYLPSEQDVLRSRVRTTGIVENNFEIDGNKFKMFDVGGQVLSSCFRHVVDCS